MSAGGRAGMIAIPPLFGAFMHPRPDSMWSPMYTVRSCLCAPMCVALLGLLVVAPFAAHAKGDPLCDHYEFRLVMAAGDMAKFDAMLKTCLARGVLPVADN